MKKISLDQIELGKDGLSRVRGTSLLKYSREVDIVGGINGKVVSISLNEDILKRVKESGAIVNLLFIPEGEKRKIYERIDYSYMEITNVGLNFHMREIYRNGKMRVTLLT